MTLTRRGTGYAINGNFNEIHRTLSVLFDAYSSMNEGRVSAVILSNLMETQEMLDKIKSLRGEPEEKEQEFAETGG